ncbi:ABC transporter substrate-binding protein [Candidatus Nomurabacteria bacterium]|nr:ABC transporter substrate-binding protein [Candidatus Nomurabacteria bacterium]
MDKQTKILAWLVVIALVVWGLFSLNKKESVTPESNEVVKIGVILPLSGVRADAGEFSQNGLNLAVEEINTDPNRKHKIDLLYEDSRYEAQVAVSAVRKLLNLDGVRYLIGPYGSSEVMAVGPITEESKAILIVTGAQSDEISLLGDYVFRIIHNSAQEAPIFARFVAEKIKNDTLHFLVINTAITDPYLKTFIPVFESTGRKIGLIERFDQKTIDFKTELTKIKAQNPSDVFLIASPKMVGLILKQAHELGIRAQFYNIGVEGPDIVNVAGSLAEGLLYPYSYDSHGGEESVRSFYNRYVARFMGEPDTLAANSYDAVYLLSDCLEKNGNDVEEVKKCLYNTSNFAGASGVFSIDDNGDAVKDIFIKTIKNGQFVKLEE